MLGLPCSSAGKESACSAGDLGLVSGLGKSPVERKGYPIQYSGLENFMDCIVHGVTKSQTQLRDFHFHFHFTFVANDDFKKLLVNVCPLKFTSKCLLW